MNAGDPSRVQIVWSLSHGELSVTELAEVVSMSQPAVSHPLRLLREGIRHVEDFL